MKTQIRNTKDVQSMAAVASLPEDVALAHIIAACAEALCPNEEDFICNITKNQLRPCYQYNASLFSRQVISRAPSFSEASGHLKDNEVTIFLYRKPRPLNQKTTRPNSVLARVRTALLTNQEIEIPVSDLPPSWYRRPEQFIYKLKVETGIKPIVDRHATFWKISQ
jgi:hypothetical protein